MHFPFFIEIGSHKIMLHAVFEVAAYFIAFRFFLFSRRKRGDVIDNQTRIWVIIATIFGSFIGSRLIGGLEDIAALQSAYNKPLYFYQNKTVLGGFLGGLFAVEMVKKFLKERKASGDLFTYPMILGLVIGRIGCFSMGIYEETYGTPTTLPWAMNLGDNVLRHPVCLYEIIFLCMMATILWGIEKKYLLANGARFKIFMISYLIFRFLLDFIKPHYTFSFGLSTIQITAFAGLVYYSRYIFNPLKLLTEKRDYLLAKIS